MRVLLSVAAAVGVGCAPTVRLELPPTPAVALPADAIAVVAHDRACQAPADDLVEVLAHGALRVDPRADLRIDLFNCGAAPGRAHAVAAVSFEGGVLANLIGAGRGGDPLAARQDLARDLAQQINPVPTLVERRVYPNAASGTARELTTLAVEAERIGDLDRAVALAEAAWAEDPNPRTASYRDELLRRRAWRR
jgi:hypothetical protein